MSRAQIWGWLYYWPSCCWLGCRCCCSIKLRSIICTNRTFTPNTSHRVTPWETHIYLKKGLRLINLPNPDAHLGSAVMVWLVTAMIISPILGVSQSAISFQVLVLFPLTILSKRLVCPFTHDNSVHSIVD